MGELARFISGGSKIGFLWIDCGRTDGNISLSSLQKKVYKSVAIPVKYNALKVMFGSGYGKEPVFIVDIGVEDPGNSTNELRFGTQLVEEGTVEFYVINDDEKHPSEIRNLYWGVIAI